jgi:hypothetical protein
MGIKLKLVFDEKEKPYLLDISSLLYDFELLHDFSLMLYAEEYSGYRFSRFFWYRNRRPIKANHKVRAVKIVKESPLTIVIEVSAIFALCGALWALIQAAEKVRNWKLNTEKLKLEAEKLKLETEKLRIELEQEAQEREATKILFSLIRRLESNPINLEDIEIQTAESDENHFIFY